MSKTVSLLVAFAITLVAGQFSFSQEAPRVIERSQRISQYALSPDGKTIAMIEGSGSNLVLLDADSGEVVYEFGQLFEVFSADILEFSPDGEYIIAASRHRGVKVLTLSDDRQSVDDQTEFEMENHAENVGIARNTPLMAGFTMNGKLAIYDYISGDKVKVIDLSDHRIHSPQDIHLSANGGHALVMNYDAIVLVDIEKGEVIQRLKDGSHRHGSRFNHDGTKVFGTSGTSFSILDVRTGSSRKRNLEDYSAKVNLLDGSNELLILNEGQLTIRDADSFRVNFELKVTHDESDPWEEIQISEDGLRAILKNRTYSKGKLMVVDLKREDD